MNLVLTVRLEILADRILPIVSHMRWSMFAVVRFRGLCSQGRYDYRELWTREFRTVFLVDTSSTGEDFDKFVRSLDDNFPGKCDSRSRSMIECRKFDDPDNDKSLRKHIGRNPKFTIHSGLKKNTTRCMVVRTTECIGSSLD